MKNLIPVMMMICFLFPSAVMGEGPTSIYKIVGENIKILPTNGEITLTKITVTETATLALAKGVWVNCVFMEVWKEELETEVQTQREQTNIAGIVKFLVPICREEFSRYATVWVDGDLVGAKHILFRHTADPTLPASIIAFSPCSLRPGETRDVSFQVLNAWKEPLPRVRVITLLRDKIGAPSSKEIETNSFGEAVLAVQAPDYIGGAIEIEAQVVPQGFVFTKTYLYWGGFGGQGQQHLPPPHRHRR